MHTTSTKYCEFCDQYLKDFSKKQIFHHTNYHEHSNFECKVCEHVFESVALLEFHRKKKHDQEANQAV